MIFIRFGKQNMKIIVKRLNALKEKNKAAQICDNMNINGYKNWFLPSLDELILLYDNLNEIGVYVYNRFL